MMRQNDRGFHRRPSAFGRFGLVILLSALLAVPAMTQDARSFKTGFSLARDRGDAGKIPVEGAEMRRTMPNPGNTALLPRAPRIWDAMPSGMKTILALEGGPARGKKPPLKTGRIAVEILAGAAVAGLCSGAAVLLASDHDREAHSPAAIGLVIGAAIGTPLVVYLIGSRGNVAGSLGWTFVGTLAGGAVAGLFNEIANSSRGTVGGVAAIAGVFLAPAAGAAAGFNMSRRYDAPLPSQTALLNVVEGKLSLGVPATQFYLSGFGKRSPGFSIRLFQADL